MDDFVSASPHSVLTVSTGSRLHFGLFDVKAPFGGVGLMVDHPRTTVSISHSEQFWVEPCRVDRITEIARRFAGFLPKESLCNALPRCLLTVESAAESHCGLGSGTQLSLAATMAMVHWFGLNNLARDRVISEIASRGKRSSIGSLGFFEGGLIAEEGTAMSYEDRHAWKRVDLPSDWRIVLAYPEADGPGVCGEAEGAAFASLKSAPPAYRDQLAGLGDEILTRATQGAFAAFSQAVSQFNSMSGELFSAHQGGCYNGRGVTTLIEQIRSLGVDGVGQSSWGPTVFAICESQGKAEALTNTLSCVHRRIVKPQSTGYSIARRPSTSFK